MKTIIIIFFIIHHTILATQVLKYPSHSWPELSISTDPQSSAHPIPIRFANATLIRDQLSALYPDIPIQVYPPFNQVIIRSNKAQKKELQHLIWHLDKAPPQIHFECHFIEITYHHHHEYESLFQLLLNEIHKAPSLAAPSTLSLNTLLNTIQQPKNANKATIKASPNIATTLKQSAHIQIGDRYPYINKSYTNTSEHQNLHHLNSGISLTLTPQHLHQKTLITDISASISTVKQFKTINQQDYPVLSQRELNTQIKLEIGTPFVIAGMIQSDDKEREQDPSILHQLPLIRPLIKSQKKEQSKTDILMVITAHTHRPQPEHPHIKIDNIISTPSINAKKTLK